MELGSDTSTSSAPSSRAAAFVRSIPAATPGCRSAGKYSRGSPIRRPVRSGSGPGTRHRRPVQRRGVERIVPADGAEHAGGVVHRTAEDRDAVERRSERHQSEPAHASVARLHADHTAEAGRLADRAAGLGAERGGHHAGGRPARPSRRTIRRVPGSDRADAAPGRTPSARWTSPWRTRPCWSCAATCAPAARRRVTAVASYGET